jgi:hypothetical protein
LSVPSFLTPGMVHGGAGVDGCRRRRTLTLRFFGEDAVVGMRQGTRPKIENLSGNFNERVHTLNRMRARAPGDALRTPGFPGL